jgi:hypothetical protein
LLTLTITECDASRDFWENGGFIDLGPDSAIDLGSHCDTFLSATAKTRRKGYKVMSRRCQAGTVVKAGKMWRVRVRVDVPGGARSLKSFPLCPISGPGSLSAEKREAKRWEIVSRFNSQDYLDKIAAQQGMGTNFREQAMVWMSNCRKRKRKPIKPVTLVNWQSYLDNHILPVLGDQPIAEVNNASMKRLVEVLVGKGLSPQSIKHICLPVKKVTASVVNVNGDELYPIRWNKEYIDAPIIDPLQQRAPSHIGEEVTKIVAALEGQQQMLIVICAATGIRWEEVSALETRRFRPDSCRKSEGVFS